MKEYGGYLSIECVGNDYFSSSNLENVNVMKMNSARYAIVEAVRDSGCVKLWMPVYMCQSVYDALDNADIEYEPYNIDEAFYPMVETLKANEMILIANYYGIMPAKFYDEMINRYGKIIFDNTQAFFSPPLIHGNVYNVYSPRKFFGVPDGAFLISKNYIDLCKYEEDISYKSAMYLLKAIELGTNGAYKDYLKNEERLSLAGSRRMSKLTKYLLSGIDYESVRKKRKQNFDYLNKKLERFNCLGYIDESCNPMVYPLLIDNNTDFVRKELVESKIYVPQWWKNVLDDVNSNKFEKNLSEGLMPLPIDQRYDLSDMKKITELVLDFLGGIK